MNRARGWRSFVALKGSKYDLMIMLGGWGRSWVSLAQFSSHSSSSQTIYLVYLYCTGRHDSNQPSPNLHQAWVGSCLAVSHLSLSPTDSAAWTSSAQARFSVIICRNSALQLTHFRRPTLREKSSSVQTNERLLQYRHWNFRYKRNLLGFFLWVDSVSNWVFLIAVLRVMGAIFGKA